MKKISLVLLIIALTLVAKFFFENLGGNTLVFKYNLKTSEKEVSLFFQSGKELSSPVVLSETQPEPQVIPNETPSPKWLGLDEELEGYFSIENENFETQVEKARSDVFQEMYEELGNHSLEDDWFFPDFEFSEYSDVIGSEIDEYKEDVEFTLEEEVFESPSKAYVKDEELNLDDATSITEALVQGEEEPQFEGSRGFVQEEGKINQREEGGFGLAGVEPEEDEELYWGDCKELVNGCPDSCRSFWPKRLTIRHYVGEQENECIPYASNYTTYEAFLAPEYQLGHIMPFVDLRGHRFDNNTYAANIGVGGRYIPNPRCDCFCEILGFNAYYDYRQGCIGYFNQIGLGIEILSCGWDFRANAYVPFGKRRSIRICDFDDYDGDYYAIRRDIESISYSFNAEVGFYPLRGECYNIYLAGGPYFIARGLCSDYTVGGEVRLRPQFRDYLALDLSWRYDSLFETIWQVGIIVNLPLYQMKCKNRYPCGISDRQIYQPVDRFEVMPLAKKECWNFNWDD